MGSLGSKLSSCGQRRLWSNWADAQADLSLRWVHTHFVGFVMSRLISHSFTVPKWSSNYSSPYSCYYLSPTFVFIWVLWPVVIISLILTLVQINPLILSLTNLEGQILKVFNVNHLPIRKQNVVLSHVVWGGFESAQQQQWQSQRHLTKPLSSLQNNELCLITNINL